MGLNEDSSTTVSLKKGFSFASARIAGDGAYCVSEVTVEGTESARERYCISLITRLETYG